MRLSLSEFIHQFDNNALRLAFIGMSNVGKSYRAQELGNQKGFEVHSIDDAIGVSLNIREGIENLAEWMGYPYDERFPETQKNYLDLELSLTQNHPSPQGNFILDTTGSVVHLDDKTLDYLKNNFLIIQLDTPESIIEEMIEEFFRTPKPLVWGEYFFQEPDETNEEALKRCYPQLLNYRTQKYRSLSDITISGSISRSPNINSEDFWQIIQKELSSSQN